MSVLNTSGEEQLECPLCMEPLEVDDLHFYPCTCGYQICRFCWNRIREGENGLCPACRKAYPENPADFTPLSQEQVAAIKTEKKAREQKKKNKTLESRKALANVRVVQNNLVFVVGLPMRLADPEILKRPEYFGKYGKIHKVVINQSTTYAGTQGPAASAYVTYMNSADALRAIQSVNNVSLDGRVLKGSLGTTKYCANFMKNLPCPKVDCMYLHELGDARASFTKEEMHQGLHQIYERSLHNALNAQTQQEALKISSTGNGSGTTTSNGSSNGNTTNGHNSGNGNSLTNWNGGGSGNGIAQSNESGKQTPSNSININNGNSHKWKKESSSSVSSNGSSKDGWPSLGTSPTHTNSTSNESRSPESASPLQHQQQTSKQTDKKADKQHTRIGDDIDIADTQAKSEDKDRHSLLEEQSMMLEQERLLHRMLDEGLLAVNNRPHLESNHKENSIFTSNSPTDQHTESTQTNKKMYQNNKQINGMSDVQANMFADSLYQGNNLFVNKSKPSDIFGQANPFNKQTNMSDSPYNKQMSDKPYSKQNMSDSLFTNQKMPDVFTSPPKHMLDNFYGQKDSIYSHNKMYAQQPKMSDTLYTQPKMSDSLYSQPKLSDNLYNQQKLSDSLFGDSSLYGTQQKMVDSLYQPKLDSNLYRNGYYGANKMPNGQFDSSYGVFGGSGISKGPHSTEQNEVRYGEKSMDKFFNDFQKNLQIKCMNGVHQVLPRPPPAEMHSHTLIESRLQRKYDNYSKHSRQDPSGSRDDDLDFDPFKETQKALAEMMEKEMLYNNVGEQRSSRAPPGFGNVTSSYNKTNTPAVAPIQPQQQIINNQPSATPHRQQDWTAMDPAIMSASFNKQAQHDVMSRLSRLAYPQMVLPTQQPQFLLPQQQVSLPPGFAAPRAQQRNECIESK